MISSLSNASPLLEEVLQSDAFAQIAARRETALAIAAFSEYLRRPAMVEDLCERTLKKYGLWYATFQTCARDRSRKLRPLIRIWERAFAEKLTDLPVGWTVANSNVLTELPKKNRKPWFPKPPRPRFDINLSDDHLLRVYELRFKPHRLCDSSPRTAYQYELYIHKLSLFLNRPAKLDDLADEVLAAFMSWMRKTMKHSPRTCNNARSYLCSLWRFLNRKGIVPISGDVRPAIEPEETPLCFTLEEIDRLLSAAETVEGTISGIPACDWWCALFLSVLESGERIGAVLQWEWTFLDEATGDIFCPAHIRKGRRRSKVYRLRRDALSAVLKIKTDDVRIFPWPMAMPTLYDHLHKVLRAAGLPTGQKWGFHALRKTHASLLKVNGGDPTDSLGHSSRRTTQVYLSPRVIVEARHSDQLPTWRKGGAV